MTCLVKHISFGWPKAFIMSHEEWGKSMKEDCVTLWLKNKHIFYVTLLHHLLIHLPHFVGGFLHLLLYCIHLSLVMHYRKYCVYSLGSRSYATFSYHSFTHIWHCPPTVAMSSLTIMMTQVLWHWKLQRCRGGKGKETFIDHWIHRYSCV
jgi:hypothetical protein